MRESETLEENTLNRAVMEAIHRITSDDMEFMENFRQNIIHVIGNYSTAKESEEYEEKRKAGRDGGTDRGECKDRLLHTGV